MPTLPINKTWLVDTFDYYQYNDADEFGGVSFKEPVSVTGCRIDFKPSYTRTGDGITRIGNAVIFCYEGATKGAKLDDLVAKSEVMIRGKKYTVKEARRYHEVTSTKPYSVELVIL